MANTLQTFILEDDDVRGVLVHLDSAWQEVLRRRRYTEPMTELLGQATAASLLMGAHLKFDGQLMLQIQSQGDLSLLVVQSDNQYQFRSLAKYEGEGGELLDITEQGVVAVMIEAEVGEAPYQGLTSIEHNSLATNLENYFDQSEQLATLLVLRANEAQAAGVLLQVLPNSHVDSDRWQHLRYLLETLNLAEMCDNDSETMISRLFAEFDKTVYPPVTPGFHCNCSEERTLAMLASLDKQELSEMVEENNPVVVGCDFCGQQYEHDPITIAALLSNKQYPN